MFECIFLCMKVKDGKIFDDYNKEILNIEENHSLNVAIFSYYLFDYLDIDLHWVAAAYLHDVGKNLISVNINKNDLTYKDIDEIKLHPKYGRRVLDRNNINKEIKKDLIETCINHHERIDGKGYYGIKKTQEEIQWISLLDCYESLRSGHSRNIERTHKEAIKMLKKGKCGKFNSKKIKTINKLFKDFEIEESDKEKVEFIVNHYLKND